MAKGFVHTVYKRDTWLNELEEGQELSAHTTKEEAVAGRERAQRDKPNM